MRTITHEGVGYSVTARHFVRNIRGAIHNSREMMVLDTGMQDQLSEAFQQFAGIRLWEEVNWIWSVSRLTHDLK
jgi:hypothetical protein